MQIIHTRYLLALLLLLLGSCGKTSAPQAVTTPDASYIVAVNQPLQYFAERLLGSDADVRMLAPKNGDPAQWQPSIEEALQLQGADLVLLNGAGYSSWLDKVAVASHRLVLTSEAFRDNWLELTGEVTHSHGPEGEHAHGGYAFTTWMDMRQAQQQAEAVAQALALTLASKQPGSAQDIQSALAVLLSDIERLHAAYQTQAQRLQGRKIIYSHPVYQYFERAYSLPGTSLHWEPDAMPSEEQWQALQNIIDDESLFIWEAEPNADIADRMHALGLSFVVIDPAANVGAEDWLSTQQTNLGRLQQTP